MKAKILVIWKGLIRAFSGSAVSALFAVSGYGFSLIPDKDGYAAVILCTASLVFLVAGISALYKLGGGKSSHTAGKFAK